MPAAASSQTVPPAREIARSAAASAAPKSSVVGDEHVVGARHPRAQRLVVALAGRRAAPPARARRTPRRRTRSGLRARRARRRRRGQGRPPAGRSARAPPRARRRDARAGIGRPVTRYFAPSRPGSRRRGRRGARTAPRAGSRARGARRPRSARPGCRAAAPRTPSARRRSRRRRGRRRAGGARGSAARERRAPARTSARTSSSPSRRGKPEIANVSSSKPASGTSCDSTRSGDPANVTVTPRSRSASATASAGRTCPAVPPAAIRHASLRRLVPFTAMLRRMPTAGEQHDEARPAVRDERERIPVSGAMPSTAARLIAAWPQTSAVMPAASSFPNGSRQRSAMRKPANANAAKAPITSDRADQAELLADHGEDHVRVRLGQVRDLPDALAEPLAGEPARADPDHRLDDLEAGALGVAPRVEEAEDARAAVRLDPDRERARAASARAMRAASSRTGTPATRSIASIISRARSSSRGRARARISPQKSAVTQAERLHELAERPRRAPPREVARRRRGRARASRARTAGSSPGPTRNQRRAPLIAGASDEHRGAEPERGEEQRRREVAQPVVVEARRRRASATTPMSAYIAWRLRKLIGSPFPSAADAEVAL